MKQLSTTWRMALAVLTLCMVAAACTNESDGTQPEWMDNTAMRINFTTPEFEQVNTRSIISDADISNVNIVVIKGGELVKVVYLSEKNFMQAIDVQGLPALPQITTDEVTGKFVEDGNENIILFYANVGDLSTQWTVKSDQTAGTRYAAIKSYTYKFADKDALLDITSIPMYGTYTKGLTEGVTNQINVSLSRALAKINFTVNTDNFQLEDGEKVTPVVKEIELFNVPLEVTFPSKSNRPALPVGEQNGAWSGSIQEHYPAYTEGSTDFVSIDKTEAQRMYTHNEAKKFVAYMPENARGSYDDIQNYTDKKNPATWEGKGMTHIKLTLTYTTFSGIIRDVDYLIFLGGNNKGDMNILGNVSYNVTANIYGDNDDATNITVTPVFDLGAVENANGDKLQKLAKETANCYMVDATLAADKEAFYLPLIQVRKGWSYIQSQLNDGNAYEEEIDNILQAGDWEIATVWNTNSADATATISGSKVGDEWTQGGSMKNYFAQLSFGSTVANGHNALIALKLKKASQNEYSLFNEGDILWSWHIWLTNYKPDATTGYKYGQIHQYYGAAFQSGGLYADKYMMDRNLGATVLAVVTSDKNDSIPIPTTATENLKYLGLYYQGHRKDPLNYTTNITTENVVVKTDGKYVKETVLNPTKYYSNTAMTLTNPWGGSNSSKGVFDPCPPGWRIPVGGKTAKENPWAGFSQNDPNSLVIFNDSKNPYVDGTGPFNRLTFHDSANSTSGWVYSKGVNGKTTTAYYPCNGRVNATYNTDKQYVDIAGRNGSIGVVWGINGNDFYYDLTGPRPSSTHGTTFGFGVRCIQE